MKNNSVNPSQIADDSAASVRTATRSTLHPVAPETAQPTSLGHRLQRALTGGPNRRFPGLHSPPGGSASPSLFLNRRLAFPILALLALLAASLLFLLPGGLLHAQNDGMIEYPENGTDPVAMFSSTDPDGDTVTWTVGGTDESLFEFSEDNPGELSFMASPNYEMPRGEAVSGTNTNTYAIIVTATDDGAGMLTAMEDVMVKVTDVEERATIELSTRQPVVGQSVMATLGNDDEVASGVRWTWTGIEGTAIASTTPSHSSTYTPLPGDANDRVRVEVKYIDTDAKEQTVTALAFEQPVAPRLAADATNEPPEFADGTTATRTIAENAAAGTAVGDPVTATDDHRTALTYQMTQATPTLESGEESPFEIDSRTGQIRVREGAELNYDVAAARTYTLTVTVADPDGGTAGEITVTVNVTDVAEAPKVTGPASKMVEEDMTAVGTYRGTDEADEAMGLTLEGADATAFGLTRITNGDDDRSYTLAFNTAPDFEKPTDTGSNNEYQVMVVATDRGLKATRSVVVRVTNMNEDGEIELTPEVPTVGKPVMAELSDDDVAQARTVTWLWSSKTDGACNNETTFERGDRIAGAASDTYTPMAAECLRVTARYTDGHGGNKSAMATVTVGARTSNVPVFAEDDPIIRSVDENAAASTDVGSVETPGTPDPVAATDADTDDTLTYTIVSVVPSSGTARFSIDNEGQLQTEEMLNHEEQASYMLEVKVTDSTGNSAMVTVTVNVNDVNESPEIMRAPDANVAPEFASATTSRTVAENTVAGTRIGDPVTANDANGDTLIYTLGDADRASFDIDSATGQLMTKAALDYEAKASYEVTVTATDPEGASDMITVTITVTEVDDMDMVGPDPADPLLTKYDDDKDGWIQLVEARDAVG